MPVRGRAAQSAYFPDALADGTVGTFITTALLVSEGADSNSIATSRFHFTFELTMRKFVCDWDSGVAGSNPAIRPISPAPDVFPLQTVAA